MLAPCRVNSAYALAIPHLAEVSPLSGGARCLLSGPLQPGICLLRNPLPAARSRPLRCVYPAGPSGRESNGFTEFHDDDAVGWVLSSPPAVFLSACPDSQAGQPTACRFGPGVCSYFRLPLITAVSTVHVCSPDHRAWPLVRVVAGRLRRRPSRIDIATCAGVRCPGALDEPLRESPQPVGY